MSKLRILGWEFVQNIPIITALLAALWLWPRLEIVVPCVVGGSVAGALLIRFTEPKIRDDTEPVKVTVTNAIAITILMIAVVAYLSAAWSSWKSDLIIGLLAGLLLGVVQSLITDVAFRPLHCAALGLAAPIGFMCIRLLLNTVSPLLSVTAVTLVTTVVISSVDYFLQI